MNESVVHLCGCPLCLFSVFVLFGCSSRLSCVVVLCGCPLWLSSVVVLCVRSLWLFFEVVLCGCLVWLSSVVVICGCSLWLFSVWLSSVVVLFGYPFRLLFKGFLSLVHLTTQLPSFSQLSLKIDTARNLLSPSVL